MMLRFERIFYDWRQSTYGHVHTLCHSFLQDGDVNPIFLMLDALASGAEGKQSIALSNLECLTNRVSMALVISVAQLCVHS
jgi:hypothetical protein